MDAADYSASQNPPSPYAGGGLVPPASAPSSPGASPPPRLDRPFAVAKAKTMIDRFSGQDGRGHWPGLDRQAMAHRLKELLDNPDVLDQGGNGLCGEAAFFNVWLWEDPWAVARFAVQMYNGGAAAVGTEEWVRPRPSLRSQDFNKVVQQMQKHPNAAHSSAEWMMMSALRDANNWIISYDGTPSDDWGAGSSNGEVANWLRATNLFKDVSVADGRGSQHSLAAAAKLNPQTSVVILSIDSHMLGNDGHGAPEDDHNAILKSPIIVMPDGTADFEVWTWGDSVDFVSNFRTKRSLPGLSQAQFIAEYFGAVVATR